MQSVITLPLLERQNLLQAAIAPPAEEGYLVGRGAMRGRIVKLIPNEALLDRTVCSKICHTMEDIQSAFDEATRIQAHHVCLLMHEHTTATRHHLLICPCISRPAS